MRALIRTERMRMWDGVFDCKREERWTDSLAEPTSNSRITVADGNVHGHAFLFKVELQLNRSPTCSLVLEEETERVLIPDSPVRPRTHGTRFPNECIKATARDHNNISYFPEGNSVKCRNPVTHNLFTELWKLFIMNWIPSERLTFSFTASVRSVNTQLSCGSSELRPISFNQRAVGHRVRIKWADLSGVSWFWHLQREETSSKKLAATAVWQDSVPLLKHLDEQRAADPTRPDSGPQTKHQIIADLSTRCGYMDTEAVWMTTAGLKP